MGRSAWVRALRGAALALAVGLLAAGPTAVSQDAAAARHRRTRQERALAKKVEALAASAREAFNEGDFAKAVAEYIKAYQLQPEAPLVYNIAFIYDRKLGERTLAMTYYRHFVEDPDADPKLVEKSLSRLEELKAEQDAEEARAREEAEQREEAKRREEERRRAAAARPVDRPMTTTALAGWVTLGAGVAVAAGGAGLWAVAAGDQHDFDAATALTKKKSLRSSGQGAALGSDILLAVGGAAVGAGALLVILDAVSEPAPSAAPGEGAGRVDVSFDARLVPAGGVVGVRGAW